jgi:glucoamylase
MGWARAALALLVVVAAGGLLLSGGSGADPETPPALPGQPPPFLGTAVLGSGGMTAAVDAYGDVVDLRASPGGPPLIDNPSARQAAGTVPSDTGIVPKVGVDGEAPLPLWRAKHVTQLYLPRTNVAVSAARLPGALVVVEAAALPGALALSIRALPRGAHSAAAGVSVDLEPPARCQQARHLLTLELVCSAGGPVRQGGSGRLIFDAGRSETRWLRHARPLPPTAPEWARELYDRSLLTLRALTDPHTGASVAGARDGWAYVWPRDASTAALALSAAGYQEEARRIARFLSRLDLGAAARFDAHGHPVPGRGPQGDAVGWVTAVARALGRSGGGLAGHSPLSSAETSSGSSLAPALPDYQEGSAGNYLGNAIASEATASEIEERFGTATGLVRTAGDPSSGLDSAAAWAVHPFSVPSLRPQVQKTLLQLAAQATRFGITPGEAWPGTDPWTAPTAWSAWSLAALGDRPAALHLLGDLRRAATPAGSLPERVDERSGIPRSTTPLAWSHAFAILALLELWPPRTK